MKVKVFPMNIKIAKVKAPVSPQARIAKVKGPAQGGGRITKVKSPSSPALCSVRVGAVRRRLPPAVFAGGSSVLLEDSGL